MNYDKRIPDRPTSIEYITNERDASRAINYIGRFDLRGWDTETTGLDPLLGAKIRTSQWAVVTGETFVFDLRRVDWRSQLDLFNEPGCTIVGQNLKFDVKFAKYHWKLWRFGQLWDTMLAGNILSLGRTSRESKEYEKVSMLDLCLRYLGKDIAKEGQLYDWSKNELADWAIEYAALDALNVLELQEAMIPLLKEQGQIRVAELEFDCIPAVAEIELNGMTLDSERWAGNYHETEKKAAISREILWKALAPKDAPKLLFDDTRETFNLNAPHQVLAQFKEHNLPFGLDRKTGNESVAGPLILQHSSEYPIVAEYIKYKKLTKALKSYGLKWLTYTNPVTGRIHATYWQIGAETGRFSCSYPNLQQVPREDVVRNCFIAREGWLFVDTDYSQMELRILAQYCRDPNFLEAFRRGEDLHRYTASLLFKIPLNEVTGKQRAVAKNINFLIVYGGGAGKLSADTGVSLQEAKQILDMYLLEVYPIMGQWLEAQARLVFKTDTARTMTNRGRRYEGDLRDSETLSGIQRNFKNLPVQGTSVDITKRALKLYYDVLEPYQETIKLCHVVHDELISEAYATQWNVDNCQYLKETAMIAAEQEYLFDVPCVVDTSVTREWTKEATDKQRFDAFFLMN